VAVTASSAQRALSVRSVVLLLPVRAAGKILDLFIHLLLAAGV
jgi:hypothetical protein